MPAGRALHGRDRECQALRGLVAGLRSGRSEVLVVRGEAGIGKTALLRYLEECAEGCRLVHASGFESEMELAFAGLQQVCGPFLDRVDKLPVPQREALGTMFALQLGQPPSRFVAGLAVLTLLSEAAEEHPLVCVIDDAQWLDDASAQTLEFVARRLVAEGVALVFAARDHDGPPMLGGLPELVVSRLSGRDAAELLDSTVAHRLDARVRDRILAEAHGNPLALLELSRALSSAGPAFGPSFGPAEGATLVSRLEQNFVRQLDALPEPSRQLLLLAAAEPLGDLGLLWRAADRLGVGENVMAVDTGGLLELGHQAVFRHPLVRSAVYRSATSAQRRKVHAVLADVMELSEDPDRRAWHRARAAEGPDEAIAASLEESADRALRRGGVAAAAWFLQSAANLTLEPVRRAKRSLAAAQAKVTAGAFDDARVLLLAAGAGPLQEPELAQVQLLQAQISHYSEHGNTALPLLLAAARRLEPIDPGLARETYLDAFAAAMFAGRLATGSAGMQQVAAALRDVNLPIEPTRSELLLQGIAALYTDGYAAAAPRLRSTVQAFATEDLSMDEAVRFAWLASCAATDLWDDVHWGHLTRRHLAAIRDVGALSVLPVALTSRVIYDLHSGDLAEAEALVAESHWIADVTGGQNTMIPYGDVCLKAMRGDTAAAERQFVQLLDEVTLRGEGVGLNMLGWFRAVMYNAVGRFEEALRAARLGSESPMELGPPKWALAELVEAGVRSGNTNAAAEALEQLSSFARASGTQAALGIESGRTALLRRGSDAEDHYREAIARLDGTTLRVEHARAELRYGEWLRQEGRRTEARTQLRSAHDSFATMGVGGFRERARQQLAAAGETVRPRTVVTVPDLTEQQAHIARLAVDGLTNPEIASLLFLSPRTVEWHLRNVCAKLGVRNRRELRQVLPRAKAPTPQE